MNTPAHPKISHEWYSKKVAVGNAAEEGGPEAAVHGPTSEDEFYARVRQGDIATTDMAMSPTRTNGKWCRVDRIPGCAWARHEWVTAQKQDAVKAPDAETIRILKESDPRHDRIPRGDQYGRMDDARIALKRNAQPVDAQYAATAPRRGLTFIVEASSTHAFRDAPGNHPFLLALGGVQDPPAASSGVVDGRRLPGTGAGGDNKGTILDLQASHAYGRAQWHSTSVAVFDVSLGSNNTRASRLFSQNDSLHMMMRQCAMPKS